MEANETVIDRDIYAQLKELMGPEFMGELVDTYQQETEALIGQLRQHLMAGDANSFGRSAHSIKSSSASLGALVFSQLARELEMLGKTGQLAEAGPRVERLAHDFVGVMERLEALKNEP